MFKPSHQNSPARQALPPFEGHGPEGAERATFAAGCFWGVEAAFREIPGVLQTAVGYTGGHVPDPTYRQVCGHRTGHAEAVEVWFDPAQVSYAQLLETFWRIHNPTSRNRQGLDFGSQYRSAIFCHGAGQQAIAIASRDAGQPSRRRPIVTQITSASAFYRAEEYHQRFREKHGHATCAVTIGGQAQPTTSSPILASERKALPSANPFAEPHTVLFRAVEHGATGLFTSYQPGDGEPWPFYQRLGFQPTGKIDYGEIVLRLDLGAAFAVAATLLALAGMCRHIRMRVPAAPGSGDGDDRGDPADVQTSRAADERG